MSCFDRRRYSGDLSLRSLRVPTHRTSPPQGHNYRSSNSSDGSGTRRKALRSATCSKACWFFPPGDGRLTVPRSAPLQRSTSLALLVTLHSKNLNTNGQREGTARITIKCELIYFYFIHFVDPGENVRYACV